MGGGVSIDGFNVIDVNDFKKICNISKTVIFKKQIYFMFFKNQ